MLALDILKAKHGDCLLLRYGEAPGKVIIIDGGPAGIYRSNLLPRLLDLANGQKLSVPLVVVSHIDDDHIHGIIDFFKQLAANKYRDQLRPAGLWHNALAELLPPKTLAALDQDAQLADINGAVTASIPQGNKLRSLANKLNIQVNYPTEGHPIMAGTPLKPGDFNIDIRVLSPSQEQLDKLTKAWAARGDEVQTAACADTSIYNLSSIVMLVQHENKRILLTGDARGDHVVKGLKEADLLDADGKIHVDIYKVSHHGSKHNSDPETFRTILADHYVLSGDRDRHPTNPGIEVIDWIVEARKERCPNREYTIWMTYDLPVLAERVSSPGKVEIIGANETYRSIILA